MKNKKGFSLVELLAVIVILGVLSVISIASYNKYVDMAKKEKEENNKNIAVMATKSYLQANRGYLPQAVGELVEIQVTELKANKYITEDLVDRNGVSCNSKSYVRVSKESDNKYTYDAHIICGNDEDSETEILPTIDIYFHNDQLETKSFTAEIKGSADESVNIASYSYRIYVNKTDESEGNYEEVYNSESITVGNKSKLNIGAVQFSKYLDVTKTNNIRVTMTVINKKGKTLTKSEVSDISDSSLPICGNKIYSPSLENKSWLNKADIANGERRRITVECEDNKESKCAKKKVTKSWPEQKNGKYLSAATGTIEIKDNSGKISECGVSPQVDNVGPTIKIRAVKNSKNSSDDFVPTNTIVYTEHTVKDGASLTVKANDYDIGTTKWFNHNYPQGVGYSIVVSDDLMLDKITWEVNNVNLPAGTSNNNVTEIRSNGKSTITYGSDSNDKNNAMSRYLTLSGEGMRYAKLTAYDKAGNKTTVHIYVNIDRTAPVASQNGFPVVVKTWKTNEEKNRPYIGNEKGAATYNYNWTNKKIFTYITDATDSISSVTYKYTTRGETSNGTDVIGKYRSIEAQGKSTIQYKACDEANNCISSDTKTVKLDWKSPTCYTYKYVTYSSYGVSTSINCGDSNGGIDVSGCSSSNQEYDTGLTYSKTYRVYDNAGNSGSCGVSVYKGTHCDTCGGQFTGYASLGCSDEYYINNCPGGYTSGNYRYTFSQRSGSICEPSGAVTTNPDPSPYNNCGYFKCRKCTSVAQYAPTYPCNCYDYWY